MTEDVPFEALRRLLVDAAQAGRVAGQAGLSDEDHDAAVTRRPSLSFLTEDDIVDELGLDRSLVADMRRALSARGAPAEPVDPDQIVRELQRIVRAGAGSCTVREDAPILTMLAIDTSGLALETVDDRVTEQLVADLLHETIRRLGRPADRRVALAVLGLAPEAHGLTLVERRTLAGRTFRDGGRAVTWGTIRQFHEPRVLKRMANIIATG